MMRKVGMLLASLLMAFGVVGGAVAPAPVTAAPATAISVATVQLAEVPAASIADARWGYCSPGITSGRVYIFDNQGYCGTGYYWSIGAAHAGTCIDSSALGLADNIAGSFVNSSGLKVRFDKTGNCSGGGSYTLPAGNSYPDAYVTPVGGNSTSSFWVY